MFFVWTGLALILAKWLELGPLAGVSWWWILSPLAAAFVWFEIIEARLGLDRRKESREQDEARRKRIASQFDEPGQKRASR